MTKKKVTKKKTTKTTAELISPTTTLGERIKGDAEAEEIERTAADDVADELIKEAPGAALIAMMDEFKKLTVKVDRLESENNKLRDELVIDQDQGGRYIVDGKRSIELPIQEEPIDFGAFAVFRSPSSGFHQKLVRSVKKRYENGETEILPATFAQFDRGVCVLTDEDLIEKMRAKEVENRAIGRPMFVEVHDKDQKLAARKGELSDRAVKSESVTADTPLEAVV